MMGPNRDFIPLFYGLTRRMYILRMAAAKSGPRFTWGPEARIRQAILWREDLRRALDATEKFIKNERSQL